MKELIKYLGDSTTDERFEKLLGILQYMNVPIVVMEEETKKYMYMKAARNIIIPARVQTDKIVLCMHYDVVTGSPAYLDNTSAICMVLDARPELMQHDNVEIVFTDKEETGGIGSSLYCDNNDAKNVKLVINLDIIGHGDVIYYCYYNVHQDILQKLNEKCIEHNYPFCDFNIFRSSRFPCVSIITTPAGDFNTALNKVYTCMHRGHNEGNMDMIDLEVIEKTKNVVLDLVNFLNQV